MTVMVVLDANQNLAEQITGDFNRAQLIQMALVKSDNNAAKKLCDNYPGGFTYCVRAMNSKATELNMEKSKFVEPTGLNPMNISTATDLVKMVKAAQTYPEIVSSSRMPVVKVKVKKKWFFFKNTNPIIGHHHSFLVSKTGWTKAAGGCIVMMIDTEIGRRIVVVLGSKNTRTRIPEAEFIATST
jgi:D-alanyl-D-alanine endopeptidase (penicillin-binding protein 7)